MKAETTRLHISPLTPALLSVALGPSLLGAAQNISFHEIQTFPERNYGYVELPTTDAEKLKKKLSGAILKGTKMQVDEARPKKRRRTETTSQQPEAAQVAALTTRIASKKRNAAFEHLVAGHELSPDRKVKRGWTEPRSKRKSKTKDSVSQSQPSKYSEKEELLFRTKIPSNKSELVTRKPKKARKTRHGAEESTIHEFEKTTKQPSFLKNEAQHHRSNLQYVEGQGWLDADGTVIEPEPFLLQRRKKERSSAALQPRPMRRTATLLKTGGVGTKDTVPTTSNAATSSDVSSSELEESSILSEDDSDDSTPSTSGITTPKAVETQPLEPLNGPAEVHPLESIFKKPTKPTQQDVAKPSLEISTAFSFFDQDTDEEDVGEPPMPLTPFTSQDMRSRGLRSAAPTPDTAHPSRFSSYDSAQNSDGLAANPAGDDEQIDDIEGTSTAATKARSKSPAKPTAEITEFEKFFWEKRGDNNRAWKARRRAVLKEQRHRENKARRPKNW